MCLQPGKIMPLKKVCSHYKTDRKKINTIKKPVAGLHALKYIQHT